MQALPVVLSACLLLALSGCTEVPYPVLDPSYGTDDGNATADPGLEAAPDVPPPDEAPAESAYPHITRVATAAYTAPVETTLASVEGDFATLRLVAGPEGLRCESEADRTAVPPGFKLVGTWSACRLLADGDAFTTARTASADAWLPMMDAVPVDHFTWNMTLGRVLENNTGQHEEVLQSTDLDLLAAPELHTGHIIRQEDWFVQSSPHVVCDTFTAGGPADARFVAHARRGRAVLHVDLAGLDVHHIEGPGEQTDAANASLERAGAFWWTAGDSVHAVAAWGDDSIAQINATIRFRGDGDMLALLPPPECPDALLLDFQEIPVEAGAIGIAAGWADEDDHPVPVEVWHTF